MTETILTTKDITKEIFSLSGRYSGSEIFFDWVKCTAYAISNSMEVHPAIYQKREKAYKDIMKKYDEKERMSLSKMCGMLTKIMDHGMKDVLGDIYMDSSVYNKHLGQFFTPYHLCLCMAELIDVPALKGGEYITVNEPSCGAGANIIAFAENMKNKGINYQEHMLAVCQDMDWNVVYMCYVQMSLFGIPAIVVQGNTLMKPYTGGYGENVLITPMYIINRHKLKKNKTFEKQGEKYIELDEGDNGQYELNLEVGWYERKIYE